ncbi:MAG: three-Cys-motif partner protein TcmP [Candidatus Accumulibacter sp.]|jgi:three-Cys-motif partner protein|nr:three-Cys-motif partner protein TcmP [Accumulibacter sp.]
MDDEHLFGGVWTRTKLDALEKYLAAFNTALSKQNFKRIYIDAFAGSGWCDITEGSQKTRIDGSARRALNVSPPFNTHYLIELAQKKLAALRAMKAEYPGKSIEIIHGDANIELKRLCKKYSWHDERAVLFLDPYGMKVEWETLKAVAGTHAIDVWYLFPYSAYYRQAAKDANAMDSGKQEAITRLLGTEEWRQVFYVPKRQPDLFDANSGDEREAGHSEMLDFVSGRLREIFPAVLEPKILYQGGDSRNPHGAPLFALYFAASNPKPAAYKLAKKIAKDVLDAL